MRLQLLVNVAMSLCLLICKPSFSQDSSSVAGRVINFPMKFLSGINSKTASLETHLTKKTEKYLQRLDKQEKKIKRKLSKKDSIAAQQLFANQEQHYREMV